MKKVLLIIPIVCVLLVVGAVIEYQRDHAPIPAYAVPQFATMHTPTGFVLTQYRYTCHGRTYSPIIERHPVGTVLMIKQMGPDTFSTVDSAAIPPPAGWQRIVIASNN